MILAIVIINSIGIEIVQDNKIKSLLGVGIKYLVEENYEEAKLEFSKAISIDEKYEKSIELKEDYIKLNELYANKEYLLAADLSLNIKGNKYLEYVESSVN